jgi:hypothetical protein
MICVRIYIRYSTSLTWGQKQAVGNMATAHVHVRYYYQFTKKVVLPAANVILSAKEKSLKQEIN